MTKTTNVIFRADAVDVERLRLLAQSQGKTMSEVVRELIHQAANELTERLSEVQPDIVVMQ